MYVFMTSTVTAIPLFLLGQIEGICITNKYFTARDLYMYIKSKVTM